MNRNSTEEMVKELQELEEMLSVLDQHACPRGSNIGRAYSRMYAELLALRDSEVLEWNAQQWDGRIASRPDQLYRCESAAAPYHGQADGPCEIYTTNGKVGDDHICGYHQDWADTKAQCKEGQ